MKNGAVLMGRDKAAKAKGAAVRARVAGDGRPVITWSFALKLGLVLLMAGSLAGCSKLGGVVQKRQVTTFDGQTFRGNAKPDGDDRQAFVATVNDPAKSLDGAIEAAAYQGTKYCIDAYGTSDIEWSVGPDTPAEQLAGGDTLSLRGRCRDF